jgi:hypothetical protein
LANQKPAAPYRGKIEEIKQYIETEFVPTLSSKKMVYDIAPLVAKNLLTDHCLAEISEFGALLPKVNEQNIPVIALHRGQLGETGVVLDQMEEKNSLLYSYLAKWLIYFWSW